VTVDGFEIIPFMGLTSLGCLPQGPSANHSHGQVLLEDEVGIAASAAIEAGST
jgi:hypothetical protein